MRPVSGHCVTTASPVPRYMPPSSGHMRCAGNCRMSMASPIDDVLVADRRFGRHLLGLHGAAHLALQRLHRLERMVDRRFADHQAEARQVAADHVVERAMPGMALDVLEQQRRALLAADQIGDGGGFEIGIDLGGDPFELAHRLDLGQPFVEVAAVGTARELRGLGFAPHRLLLRRD